MAPAAHIVTDALLARRPEERARFLREVISHAAAGIVVLEGSKAAAEALYRLADAVVSREVAR